MMQSITAPEVKRKNRLSLNTLLRVMIVASGVTLAVFYLYMTRAMHVRPTAAAGLMGLVLAFITIPESLGLYAGLKIGRGAKGAATKKQLMSRRPRLLPWMTFFSSVVSVTLVAWAIHKMNAGETREASVLLIGACAVSLPFSIILLMNLRKVTQSDDKESLSPTNRSLSWSAVTLIFIANVGLAAVLYGLYLIVQYQSITSGTLCFLLGALIFVFLHYRADEVGQKYLCRESAA